jgi:threonyl-tRNA synthetase
MKDQGVRLEADLRNEKIGFKIREARNQKIPYMIVLGDKEMETGAIAVRKRGEDQTKTYSFEEFIAQFRDEVDKRV